MAVSIYKNQLVHNNSCLPDDVWENILSFAIIEKSDIKAYSRVSQFFYSLISRCIYDADLASVFASNKPRLFTLLPSCYSKNSEFTCKTLTTTALRWNEIHIPENYQELVHLVKCMVASTGIHQPNVDQALPLCISAKKDLMDVVEATKERIRWFFSNQSNTWRLNDWNELSQVEASYTRIANITDLGFPVGFTVHNKWALIALVKENGHALEYASESLKGDREVALTALKQDIFAFVYLDQELKNSEEFLHEVGGLNSLAISGEMNIKLIFKAFAEKYAVVMYAKNVLRGVLLNVQKIVTKIVC